MSEAYNSDILSKTQAEAFVKKTISENAVLLFMKGTPDFPQCGFSSKAVKILKSCGVNKLVTVNVLDNDFVRQAVKEYAGWPTIPQLYISGELVGGSDIIGELEQSGELVAMLPKSA